MMCVVMCFDFLTCAFSLKSEKQKTSIDFRPKRFAVVYDVVNVSDDVNITRDRVCMHDINV
jgi:hypothetical protein